MSAITTQAKWNVETSHFREKYAKDYNKIILE